MSADAKIQGRTMFGHPTGLFVLFFAEMWERFSYYGMRALLLYYIIKGFLKYDDNAAYGVYGAYTSLVYATPFIGGMLADRLLGRRKAVVLGGALMAAGHLMMTLEFKVPFFVALSLLIVGNGFFKPNISTIVGAIYPEGSGKRDAGFTLFYMGINLGAAMSPLLCGYVGETFGWHYGFGMATIGMLIGLAVFVSRVPLTQILTVLGALSSAAGLMFVPQEHLATSAMVSLAIITAAFISFVFLDKPAAEEATEPTLPKYITAVLILIGAVGGAAAMVLLPGVKESMGEGGTFTYAGIGSLISAAIEGNPYVFGVNVFVSLFIVGAGIVGFIAATRGGFPQEAGDPPDSSKLKARSFIGLPNEWTVYLGVVIAIPVFALLVQRSQITGVVLSALGIVAFGGIAWTAIKSEKIVRERLFVVLILCFFSMLFWSFFEQAGTSINNFTDRNVDRVYETTVVTEADVGKTIKLHLSQEQLGRPQGGEVFTMTKLQEAKDDNKLDVEWTMTDEHVGMGLEGAEVPGSIFQSANPIFILLFAPVFSALWSVLGSRKLEPSTPFKFVLGLVQLGLGFAVMWYGAQVADDRGMTGIPFLLLGYLLFTTGELCLSPVGLSMVTKLAPAKIVGAVMGAWFLATAFSAYLNGLIAMLTGVGGEGGEEMVIPAPIDTVNLYGDVFGVIAIATGISAVILLALTPVLKKWMHEGEHANEEPAAS